MIEKAKIVIDKGRHFSTLLNDLSKMLDCLPQDLITAKLHLYEF